MNVFCFYSFLDSYSQEQLNGINGTNDQCGQFYTYDQLGVGSTVGGYRVKGDSHAHPCGEVMRSLFNGNSYRIYR